jgi:sec-independent protein translocase protein TatA
MATSSVFLAVFGFSGMEVFAVLAIVMLLFGGQKLPGLAKGLGQSIKEFKKAAKDEDETPKPTEVKKAEEPKTTTTHGSN